MARTPKPDILPAPGRRGGKPKTTADVGVAAPAESSTPARGRRGRKPGQQADAPEPALPLAAGVDQLAAEASPSADGPGPAGEGDTSIAGMAVPVSGEPTSNASPKKHENAAPHAGNAVPISPHSDTSAPAARWDDASDTVSFDWPAIERTAAQGGPNQAMAKLLIAARAEGAHSRWPL